MRGMNFGFVRRQSAKLCNMLFAARAEKEMKREMQAHFTLLQDEFEARGMTPEAARQAAARAYGGMEQARELHRDARTFVGLEQAFQDLRYALRALRNTPGFTLVAVCTLALGISVNTTMFSMYNAVALKSLPIADPDRVVRFERWVESRTLGTSQYGFSYPEFAYCRDRCDSFSGLVAASWVFNAQGLAGQLVSSNYFAELGVRPVLGSGFLTTQDDATPGANATIVISYPYWRRAFGGDRNVVGRTMKLNGATFLVVGVAPPEFTGTSVEPQVPDFWAPLQMHSQLLPGQDLLRKPSQYSFTILGRIKPSMDIRSAQARTDLSIRQFTGTYLETDRTSAVTLRKPTYFPNTDDPRFRALAAGIMGIVGLVLFVACANTGNMLLARSAVRQREFSTRLALGAGRGRIFRQLLTENILLSCAGGGLGFVMAGWSTKLLGVLLQENAAVVGGSFAAVNVTPDSSVLLFVICVSLLSGVFFGLSPALQFTKPDLAIAMKRIGGLAGDPSGTAVRGWLIAAQVMVSVLLLAMAGLLSRGLVRAEGAEPGFETKSLFVLEADWAHSGGADAQAVQNQRAVSAKLRTRPEFAGVALGGQPLGGTWTPPILVGNLKGRTLASRAGNLYFQTVGIPLVRGREFTASEAEVGAPVAIVSLETANRYWPSGDAIGSKLTLDVDFRGKLVDYQVVGIAKDARMANLTRSDPGHVYVAGGGPTEDHVLLRVRGDRNRALKAATDVAESVDRSLLANLKLVNLEEGPVSTQRALAKMMALLAGVLAGLALTLAGVGVYGVVAYTVSQRTREIGVRVALGARQSSILRAVVIASLRPVFMGMAVGLALAWVSSALLHQTLLFPGSMDLFYGVPFYDPATFVTIVGFVVAVAAIASMVPSRRALLVDPMVALRHE